MKLLNDRSFDQAIKEAEGTLIVKFAADWCVDCRRIDGAYAEFPGQFKSVAFATVDTEEALETAQRFEVKGIPSFLVFRNGELVDRLYSRDAKSVKQVTDFVAKQADAAE